MARAVAAGITATATVHDSFGPDRFRQIIREQFVRMCGEHDVLAEVLERGSQGPRGPEVTL
jgi:DNA-directed RNA polymerase